MKSVRAVKPVNQGARTSAASDQLVRARDRDRAHAARGVAADVPVAPGERVYKLYSFCDSRGALLDFKVLPADDASVRNVDDGVFPFDEATTAAPDPRTAYLTLVYGMFVVPRERLASAFWQRVAMIPFIRFAAALHIGLRGIGPALRTVYYRTGPHTYGGYQ